MAYTFNEIIELAQRSGIPYKASPGDQLRPHDLDHSGNPSDHSRGWAVDFMGESQDQLAQFFMALAQQGQVLEVTHYSKATGKWYGYNGRRGRPIDPTLPANKVLVGEHSNHIHVAMSPEQVGPGSMFDKLRKGATTVGDIVKGLVSGTPFAGALGTAGGILSGAPSTVTEAIGGVGNALSSIAQSAMSIGRVSDMVTRAFLPTNLLRGLAFLGGSVFILIGIFFLASEVKESTP